MIPILYNEAATDFSSFGIGALADCTSCVVSEERNGEYECKLKYPTSGALYAELKKERIIKAKPNDTSAPQAFRIYRITVPLNGIVTVYAQHISYDLATIGVKPFSLDLASPQVAIETVLSRTDLPHNFSFRTDYSVSKPFKVEKPKSARACLGGTEGSLMNLWGGEFEWDNYHIIHHRGRGSNNGVTIEYGKNLTKLEQDTDISGVFTDLFPFAVNETERGDEVVTLPEVTLPITTTLNVRKSVVKDFTDSFDRETTITVEMLREKATAYLANNPLGVETPSIKVSFEPLWKQPEYAAILERVSLCDTVTVKHRQLGITLKTKVIKTEYDTISEKYTSITLGSCKSNLTDTVRAINTEVQTTQKEVDRFPFVMKSAIETASKLITGQSGGYVVLHGSATGQPYELLVLDAPTIEDAVNVWRWNVGGLGFSSHGYNGPYETAITADGSIVADFITTGSLVANIIKAGVLSSQDGSSYWNLETGEVVLRSYATNSKVEQIEGSVTNLSGTVNGLSGEVNGLSTDVSGLSGTVDDLSGSVEGLNGNVNSLSGSVSSLSTDVSGLSGEVNDLSGSVDGLNGSVNSLSGSVSSLGESVDGLSGDVSTLSGSVSGLQSDVGNISDDLSDLSGSVDDLSTGLAAVEGSVGTLSTSVTTLTTKQGTLETSVNGLTSNVSALTTRVTTAEGTLVSVQSDVSSLQQTATSISATVAKKVDETYGNSSSSFGWKLQSTGFYVYSNASTVMTITSSGLSVKGAIDATSGSIGNLTIDGYLYFGGDSSYYISANYSDSNYYISLPGLRIDKASTAVFSGKLSAPSGNIGGFTIASSKIYKTKTTYSDSNTGVYIGTDGIGLGAGTFYVTSAGKLYATNAEISGTITATSGTIGGFTINESSLTNASGGSSIQITSGNYTTYLGANNCYSTYYDGTSSRGWSLSHSQFRISSYTSGYYPGIIIKPNYTKRSSYTSNGTSTIAEACITSNQTQSYYADSSSTIGNVSPFIIGIYRDYMKSPYSAQPEWGAYLRFASHQLAELVYDSYYGGKWQIRDVYTGRTYDLTGHKFYFWTYTSKMQDDIVVSCTQSTHGLKSVSGAIVVPRATATSASNLSGYNHIVNNGHCDYGITISGTTVYVALDYGIFYNGFYCLIYGS